MLSIVYKAKADVRFKPEEYFQYFEDLIVAPNAEIEPEGGLKALLLPDGPAAGNTP